MNKKKTNNNEDEAYKLSPMAILAESLIDSGLVADTDLFVIFKNRKFNTCWELFVNRLAKSGYLKDYEED